MLKTRKPPLLLLALLKHPRGPGHVRAVSAVSAVVSDQPTCPEATTQAAASAINPYPLSVHVPDVTMGYTTKLLLEVLHRLPGP